MTRIAIVGNAGAGKSSLARELSRRTGVPVVHLDALFWRPGWVQSDRADFRNRQADALGVDAWIADGNYGATLDLRLSRADTIVFLDLRTAVCLGNVMRRWATFRGRSRPDMPPDCPERIDLEFLRWITTYNRRERPAVLAAITNPEVAPRVVRLSSHAAVQRWLDAAYPAG